LDTRRWLLGRLSWPGLSIPWPRGTLVLSRADLAGPRIRDGQRHQHRGHLAGNGGEHLGYRRELRDAEPRFRWLIVPSLVGGLTGALLLRWTPPALFDRMVPFLILFATLLFMAQEPIQRILKTDGRPGHQSAHWFAGVMFFQLMVGLYGGYFGAGIGILMLAALSIMGSRHP